MTTFLKAALSYYGIPDTAPAAWAVDQSGRLTLVVELPVHDDCMGPIAQRMATMKADAEALAQQQAGRVAELPDDKRMRDEYNGMDKRTKSEFGSFARYKAWRLGQAMDEVVAMPTASDSTVSVADVVPPYVYLAPSEATPQQKAMAVGRDEKGNYAVALEDLTPEQEEKYGYEAMVARDKASAARNAATADELRADYVARTVAARGTLDGSDGKPTSNADDFGGVPG